MSYFYQQLKLLVVACSQNSINCSNSLTFADRWFLCHSILHIHSKTSYEKKLIEGSSFRFLMSEPIAYSFLDAVGRRADKIVKANTAASRT